MAFIIFLFALWIWTVCSFALFSVESSERSSRALGAVHRWMEQLGRGGARSFWS